MRFHQFVCIDCRVVAKNMRSLVTSLRERTPVVIFEKDKVQDGYVDLVMQALEREGADRDGR